MPTDSTTRKVLFVSTPSGYELPVIDVTHPIFKMDDSAPAVESLRREFAAQEEQRKRMPKWLMRLFMRWIMSRSLLGQALLRPSSPVLDGLNTYVFKLPAKILPPQFDDDFNRRLASSPAGKSMALRVQQMARLIVKGLRPHLAAQPDAPLYLINIAGGSAIDSLNALILLRAEDAQLLRRQIVLHILDPDERAPLFGRDALAALSAPGEALAGLSVQWIHDTYDWNDTKPLGALIGTLAKQRTIVAASSEGGLFEYGSDAAIVANLKVLHAEGHGACAIAGSVTRADALTRGTLALSLFKLIPRGVDGFATLIRDSGYKVAEVAPGLMGDQVLLLPREISS